MKTEYKGKHSKPDLIDWLIGISIVLKAIIEIAAAVLTLINGINR